MHGYSRVPTDDTSINEDNKKQTNKWNRIWRGINLLMVIFFILAAYVQVNDPDPYIWVPAYVLPAVLSFAIFIAPDVTERSVWRMSCEISLGLYATGMLFLLSVVIERLAKGLHNPLQHEEGREFGGTVIILVWLCICRFTKFGSSNPNRGVANALLLLTCVLGCLPLVIWGLCFVDGLHANLAHCKDMFPGMLGS